MKKLTKRLLWFQLLLMNIGLACGTIGLVLLIQSFSPLVEYGGFAIVVGLLYVFFYVLLVIGVVGVDVKVKQKGIEWLLEDA